MTERVFEYIEPLDEDRDVRKTESEILAEYFQTWVGKMRKKFPNWEPGPNSKEACIEDWCILHHGAQKVQPLTDFPITIIDRNGNGLTIHRDISGSGFVLYFEKRFQIRPESGCAIVVEMEP